MSYDVVGLDFTNSRIFVNSGNGWIVEKLKDKWVVRRECSEKARYYSDGSMGFGEANYTEVYEFQTAWAAYAHAATCNRLEEVIENIHNPQRNAIIFANSGIGSEYNLNSVFKIYKSPEKVVLSISRDGKDDYFDLPFFLWVYFKNTKIVKVAKMFWYGWA